MVEEIKAKPNQDIIEMLQVLLDAAKSGELQSVAVAAVYSDARTGNAFCAGFYPVNLLGELQCLQRDVMDCNVDIRRAPLWEFCE